MLSIPTLLFFRDGHEVARLDGLIDEDDLERPLGKADPRSRTMAIARPAADDA